MIPVIQALINRVVPRIRALVVVPSRDLALQVIFVQVFNCRPKQHLIVLLRELICMWVFWEELMNPWIIIMMMRG